MSPKTFDDKGIKDTMMKTKLLLVLALLASGCSPALDERYVKSSPYAVNSFLGAVKELIDLPMHDYWRYVFIKHSLIIADFAKLCEEMRLEFILGRGIPRKLMKEVIETKMKAISSFISYCDRFLEVDGAPSGPKAD